jgi:integrase
MEEKMWLQRRSNGYYYIRTILPDGRERWTTTGTKIKREALEIFRQGVKPKAPPKPMDLTAFRERVLQYAEANYAPRTHEVYQHALDSLIAVFGDRPLVRIDREDVDQYKAVQARQLSPVSVNIRLRTIRSAFNLAVRWGMLHENPFTGVQLFRIPEQPPAYLTYEQFNALCMTIGDHWIRDIVVFATATGMRQGEIRNLEWRHVDMTRRIVHVTSTATFKTKTGKRRTVPLNETAYNTLAALERGHSLVFTYKGKPIRRDSLTWAFKKHIRAAELPDEIHFHSLRHTFASWLVQDGVSLFQVGRLLGHTDTKTTEIYAHLQPETMHDVVDRLKMT